MLVQFGQRKQPGFLVLDCWEASSPEDQKVGLSGVSHLPPGTGLLFVFESEDPRTFHMPAECRFPIDMIFIGANSRVRAIARNCVPGAPEKYRASARYVLEVPAGLAAQYGIQVNDAVELEQDAESDGGGHGGAMT